MIVQIAAWNLRCNDCKDVYAETFYDEQTAREVEEAIGELCSDCLRKRNLAAAVAESAEVTP